MTAITSSFRRCVITWWLPLAEPTVVHLWSMLVNLIVPCNDTLDRSGSLHTSWTIFVFWKQQNLGRMFPVASAAVHSKAVILLLTNNESLFIVAPLVLCFVFGHCSVVQCRFEFCNYLPGEEGAGWFTLIVFWCHALCRFLTVPWVGLQCVIVAFPGN